MRNVPQWICWREEPNPGKPKPKKVPFNPSTGKRVDPLCPSEWMTYDAAAAWGHKLGFVFTEDLKYFFFDLDGCVTNGIARPDTIALLQRFPGAYVELSHNGTGFHVVGKYTGDRPVHGVRNSGLGLELYTGGRFMALGSGGQGDPDQDCTAALQQLAVQYFPPVTQRELGAWTEGPREDWTGDTDDDKLIAKACKSTSMFGSSCPFASLWKAKEEDLGKHYPDAEKPWNASDADLALARHLAFWTGNDCERIVRLMWKSALAREKWNRTEWMRNTVLLAVASTDKVYDYVRQSVQPPPPVAPTTGAVDVVPRDGYQFMGIAEQIELFKGCMYVISRNAVMLPDGRMLKQQQFNAVMPSYDYARSNEASAKTVKTAWQAFNESLGFNQPIADEAIFDPTETWEKPLMINGVAYANTYRPIETPCREGDVEPFMAHLRKLLPVERDRQLLLAWMAALVQHKGVKFQWAPLLQGVEGNGKTLITAVLRECIGLKHFHSPQADDLGNNFNAWLGGNILIGVEDISITNGRKQILEILKPMITNPVQGTTSKGVDAETSKICCNFIFNSNHRDALIKTENDRRFAVFFTAQQSKADLERDEMTGRYFPDLYNWLRAEGYAHVHHYLKHYDIPDDLNPANGWTAPETSSHREAIAESLGPIEQRVLDMAAEERPGFRHPWASRSMLTTMLEPKNISPAQTRKILAAAGYVRHPAGQRTHRPVAPDGRKVELWIRPDHPDAQLTRMCDVEKKYTEANSSYE